ncbi:CoA pyrophosphatase [Robertmurraya yapensis]|uniref:CoA pyrophosphatase n=1 Tax=Bacillus yapensis TaxID=2492960 RepID=A0A431VY40_9BACI|nr:CoA pyrophosphatase [Bacillus yapensis]RTR27869.1 CoA pyrophosphatase [Bacillus yapensis]TKS94272.1 NUDIX domain-containing protein [Bacillus yapensis]
MDINNLKSLLQNRKPRILGSENYSNYAVLLPIIEKADGLHVLFEVRSHTLRRQPGEICFPGGRVDASDRNEGHTAIRETSEELGIAEEEIINVSPLDYMVSSFGSIIYPYLGFIKESARISPNPDEVAEVFSVPLTYLQQTKPEIFQINFKLEPEENFPFHHITGGEKYKWQVRQMEEYFYYYEDKVIWGLTARILSHFLEIINS